MLVRIFLISIIAFGLSNSAWSQSQTQRVDNISVSSTRAKMLGKTKPIKDLIAIEKTSDEKRDAAKRLKKVPDNFLGRRSNGNAIYPELEHQGPDPIRQWKVDPPTRMMSSEPLVNVDGLTNFRSPTDPTGDVSDQHYLQSINATTVGVYDLQGNIIETFLMNTLWSDFGANSAGDPIILYDEVASRWILTEFTGPANLLVAISETSDPLGSYFAYSFATPNFPDYPKYSISPQALVVTTNEQGAGTLHQYFLDRQQLLAGEEDVSMLRVAVNGNNQTEQPFFVSTPVDWNGGLLPFDPRPMTMALNDSSWPNGSAQDQVEIYTFNLDFDIPNNTSVDRTSIITTPFDTYPCSVPTNFGFHCVPQRGGAGLDGLPELILNVPHQRNFGTHESLVFNFVTDVTDGENLAGMRWVELRRTATTDWALYQEGTFAPDDGLDRFMGGIAIDAAGSIAMAYNVTSDDTFVGMAYTGRYEIDSLGVMSLPEVVIVEGSSTINSGGRFGDYTQMSVMPNRNQFWFTGEYAGGGGTRTRIVSFELEIDTFDLRAFAVVQPDAISGTLTTTETIQAEYVNAGSSPLSNFDVSLLVDGVEIITETVNLTLGPRQRYFHDFSQTVDLSVTGDYLITATISHPSDQDLENNSISKVVSQLADNDASVSANAESFDGCSPFEIVISNDGFETIESATIDVILNGVDIDEIAYAGNIPFRGSDVFLYENMISDPGDNVIEFVITSVNGIVDVEGVNTSGDLSYFQNLGGRFITINILADDFPQETGWSLETLDGIVLQSGTLGNTPRSGFYTRDICVTTDSCYVIRITDTQDDGICCGFGRGNIEIIGNDGEVLFQNNGDFGSELARIFCEQCEIQAEFAIGEADDGADNGSIQITAQGGNGPFMYSIDGGINFQEADFFSNLAAGDYEVVVIAGDAGTCQLTETVTVGILTSTRDLTDEFAINMYPNPTKGVFNIEIVNLDYDEPLLNIDILDANGKNVYNRQLGNYDGRYIGTFSLFDYPQGVYYLKLANTTGGTMHRIVKVD